jgi:hypothetical protein
MSSDLTSSGSYASPLPELASEVDALSARVEAHLKKMGFAS